MWEIPVKQNQAYTRNQYCSQDFGSGGAKNTSEEKNLIKMLNIILHWIDIKSLNLFDILLEDYKLKYSFTA